MSSPNQLSFLPDDYLERKAQRRTNAICAVLFLVVLVAIISAFTYSEKSNRDIDRRYDAKLREFSAEARRIQQAEQMQDKQRTMARQAELAASLLEKIPRSFVLAEVTNSMPPGVSLLDLILESKKRASASGSPLAGSRTALEQKRATLDSKKTPVTPASDPKFYDVNIKLTGIATTDVQVAQFISKLNNSTLLKDVNLVISDQYDKEGEQLRKFQIECTLDPDAEIQAKTDEKTVAVELKK
ncbi:MAG: PilN domain-containing protein [Tepidisphaeraceae bacterium]